MKGLLGLFFATPPAAAAHAAPPAIVETMLPDALGEAAERVVDECELVDDARFFQSTGALDRMIEAMNDAKARGFGDRGALLEALAALRDAPILQSAGKRARRINAKTRRRMQRAIDAVCAEAFFEASA